jgi:CarboxypepD_reg-like domain
MKKSLTVSIPKPCTESWSSFTPTDTGGFCGSCNKNVIDFTHASEADILNFFTHKPAHACGRFRTDQLKTYPLTPGSIKPGFTLLRAGVLSLLLLLISKPGSAHTITTQVETEHVEQPRQVIGSTTLLASQVLVKGVVTSAEDGAPIMGVNILVKGTDIGTVTDHEGTFEISVDVKHAHALIFAFIGYKTVEFPVQADTKQISIAMETDDVLFGEVIWTGEVNTKDPYTEKTGFFGRVWTKIKNVL